MARKLIIEASNEAYKTSDVRAPITVADLRDFLEEWDDDDILFLSFDHGYSYGTIRSVGPAEDDCDE